MAPTDPITLVDVPHPHLQVETLEQIEDRLIVLARQMREPNELPYPLCLVYIYLVGYRDALMNRPPNVPPAK